LSSGGGRFPATRRSAVEAVADGDPAVRARAFEVLVRGYWKPVYKHLRARWKKNPDDAKDLTQAFFARAFERGIFARYEPARARFRTYLRTCLDAFVMDEGRDARRQKRGGDAVHVSLDFEGAERELELSSSDAGDVEATFDREWTRSLFSAAVDELRAGCSAQGKDAYFRVFERYVLEEGGPERPSYRELAVEIGVKVTDVTNYLAWSRREFRRLVLERLRALTASEEEFESEARSVLGIEP
jgi:RNA polymerase sigma factor (sigma-70 family)